MNEIQQMLRDIQMEIELTRKFTGIDSFDKRVMAAMKSVPRDQFVPEELRRHAYENRPLPIGEGQTISQPYIVALMTHLLAAKPSHKVLEIGTGSCYQAAILAQLVKQVYSVEIVSALAKKAQNTLTDCGYTNVTVLNGDGYYGWPEHAPYDGIMVTAATPFIPQPLIEQLRNGGKLVIPVGLPYRYQELMVVEKKPDGQLETREILGVAFVPLTGNHYPVQNYDPNQ